MDYPPVGLPSASEESAPGVVEDDKTCVQCGYNLRTLSTQGRCPECGLRVAESLRSDRLALANSGWRDHVCSGIAIRCWTMAAFAIIVGLSMLNSVIPGGPSAWGLRTHSLWLCNTLLLLACDWLLTTPECGGEEIPGAASRRAFRVMLVVNAFGWFSYYVVVLPREVSGYLWVGIAVTAMISQWLFLLYVRQFSRRVPDYLAVRQWTLLILVNIIGSLGAQLLPRMQSLVGFNHTWNRATIYLSGIGTLLYWGQTIWIFLLLIRLYRQLRAAPRAS